MTNPCVHLRRARQEVLQEEESCEVEGQRKRRRHCVALNVLIPPAPSPGAIRFRGWANKPYLGDWSAGCWNAQGLLASNCVKQHVKFKKAASLAGQRDFLVITETHGNEGKCRGRRLPKGWSAFWSNEVGGGAGVGIWIKNDFVSAVCGEEGGLDWVDVLPGRAGVLRCWGPQGALQIGMVYLQTGDSGGPAERSSTMKLMAAELGHGGQALSILMGDFNFVEDQRDRMSGTPPVFTGGGDHGEARHMKILMERLGMRELEQEEFTYRFQDCRSRLDRIYTNMARFEWLDRDIGCLVLDWNDVLSRHRPLVAFRRSRKAQEDGARPLQSEAIGGPIWRHRVLLSYLEKMREVEGRATGILKLLFAKQAVQEVTCQVAKEKDLKLPALDAAGKLACAMRYIRAVGRQDWRKAAEARIALPEIGGRVKGSSDQDVQGTGLGVAIQDWIMELAGQVVQAEMEVARKMQLEGDEQGVRRKREHILRQLKRIHGGSTGAIKAMRDTAGEVHTEPQAMVGTLQQHWEEVFTKKEVDEGMLERWLSEMYPKGAGNPRKRDAHGRTGWRFGLPPENDGRWQITKKDVARATKMSKDSAPGPDGLPHKVWKELGEFGTDILFEAMGELQDEGGLEILNTAYGGKHQFNESIMACLPKSVSGNTEDGKEIYEPGNTRPLAIGNTDNRLMCSAARLRWEGIFGSWISLQQKGFIRGRSLLSNVLVVDNEAMKISLTQKHGAILLFDFRAAFPSIERRFMLRSLEWLGMPMRQRRFVEAIYDRTTARIRAAGAEGEPFEMTRGIRQGCPLSPLIFAIVVDVLLRKLTVLLQEGGQARAFADDTAVVVEDFFRSLPGIATTFHEYALISGLWLNLKKTVIVPLWRPQEMHYKEIHKSLAVVGYGWEEVPVQDSAKYLGFLVGPGRDAEAWTKATNKWQARARLWSGTGLGLQYSALMYNVFAASVLTFLSQLLPLSARIIKDEKATMLQLAKGPAAWANAQDLWMMGTRCSLGRSFHCLQARADAAMLRALTLENWERPIRVEAEELQLAESTSEQHDRMVFWKQWYDGAFPKVLLANRRKLEQRGIKVHDIKMTICMKAELGKEREALRASLQKTVALRGLEYFAGGWQARIRHKLIRWKLPGNQRHHAQHVESNLQALGRVVPPRVAAAVWGLVWNRWTTGRRFQKCSPCPLGCGAGADSIEHLVGCRVAREAGRRFLRVDGEYQQRLLFCTMTAKFVDQEAMACWAVLVYATYMASNQVRHASRGQGGMVEELIQHCRQAAEGHPRLAKILCGRWTGR